MLKRSGPIIHPMYVIQGEMKDAEKLLKLAKKNKKLKIVKVIAVTEDERLVGAIKRNYNVVVMKQDLLI